VGGESPRFTAGSPQLVPIFVNALNTVTKVRVEAAASLQRLGPLAKMQYPR